MRVPTALDRAPAALDRTALVSGVFGGTMVVAGGLVAAVNSAAPFERGSWLAAYLVLVGGVAQIALAAGRAAFQDPARFSSSGGSALLLLWNLGSLAVPAGVLAGAAALVTVGSAALLAALAGFAAAGRSAPRSRRRVLAAYRVLILGLAVSVAIGMALAEAPPLTWF